MEGCWFQVVAVIALRAAHFVPHFIDGLRGAAERRSKQSIDGRLRRQRIDYLADASDLGTTAHETERHICAEGGCCVKVVNARPAKHCSVS